MIGGLVMIYVAIWIYQSAIKAGVSNIWMWVGICAGAFLASQFLLVDLNVYILESMRSDEGGANYERDLTSVGDRKNEGGFQSGGGAFLSTFFELMPPIAGILIVAVIRCHFMLKEKIGINTLFTGMGDIFVQTFKSATSSMKDGIKK